jgi:hypothetical protein
MATVHTQNKRIICGEGLMVCIGQQCHHVAEVLWIVVIDQDTILLIGTLRSNGGLIVLIKPPALAQTSCRLFIVLRNNGIHAPCERSSSSERVVITMNCKTPHECVATIKRSIAKTSKTMADITYTLWVLVYYIW